MTCNPSNIIKVSPNREKTRFDNGDTKDIITVIMDMDAVADKYVDAEAAKCLKGRDDYETLGNVWTFVKKNVKYKADSRGREVVKSPAALFSIGKGDCKSFSIAEAAILRALGFKGIRYRFVSYDGRDITHVYVVCKLKGEDVILDAVHTHFDDEVRYSYKRDITAARGIQGIGATHRSPNTLNTSKILGSMLIFWGVSKLAS